MRRRGRKSDVSRNVWTVAAVVVATGISGLACARSAEERQLDSMRIEIQDLQQAQDRENARGSDETVPAVTPAPHETPAPPIPSPPTFTLGTEGPAAPGPDDSADTEDTAPRPTIRVVGATRGSGRGALRGEDAVDRSDPDQSAIAHGDQDRTPSIPPEAARAYDAAMALVRAKQLDRALDALAAFLVRWPDHPYADGAMYWRGECYYSRGEYARAVEQLEGVLARYPEGTKVADAMLKLGMAEQKLGHADKSRAWFERLSQRFPESAAARRVPQSRASDVPTPDILR